MVTVGLPTRVLSAPPPPAAPTLPALFEYQRDRRPDAPAIVDDGRTWTYDELGQRARAWAGALAAAGVRPGDTVALLCPNGVDWATGALAAVWLGAVLAPVNVRFRVPEIADLLSSLRPRAVITAPMFLTNPLLERLGQAMDEVFAADRSAAPAVFQPADLDHAAAAPAGAAAVSGIGPLVVFWTSGSTGRPKGVLHGSSLIGNVWNWVSLIGYGPSDRVLATRPFYYIAGACWNLFGVLATGGCVIAGKLFTPAEMATALAAEQVTVMSGSPAVWEALLDSPEFAAVEPGRLHVRRAIVGGAPLSRRLFETIRARFPAAPLVQTYGMTELRGYMMTTVPEDTEDVRFGTVGGLLPGFETELRAADGARITAPDTPGELYVRGEILQDYTLDGQAVPARGDDGWFATGDQLSCRGDGNWVFHTRLREIAKVRGESVSLSSVDLALAELPDVVRAVTVAFPVEHGDRLEAVVEVAQSSTAAEILAAARDHMAPFRVPARIWIKSPAQPWPTLPSGKISRSMVAQQLIATEPTGEAP